MDTFIEQMINKGRELYETTRNNNQYNQFDKRLEKLKSELSEITNILDSRFHKYIFVDLSTVNISNAFSIRIQGEEGETTGEVKIERHGKKLEFVVLSAEKQYDPESKTVTTEFYEYQNSIKTPHVELALYLANLDYENTKERVVCVECGCDVDKENPTSHKCSYF